MLKCFAVLGGGIGDVLWDWLHDDHFTKIPSLVERYGARIRIISQCSCPGTRDLLAHNPHVHEVIEEPWQPPSPELAERWNTVTEDGYLPLSDHRALYNAGVTALQIRHPGITLADEERTLIHRLTTRRPCVVMQPYAGLSDRDGLDRAAIARLSGHLQALNPHVQLLVIGKNHDRGHKYRYEECPQIPGVIDLIDKLGIRVAYHLVAQCDAFIGAHSNLIRTAWDHRKRTALVVPDPPMTRHLPTMDIKYTYGIRYPENRTFTYEFDYDNGGKQKFETLDYATIARFVLRGE